MDYEPLSSKATRSIKALLAVRGETIESLSECTAIPHSTLKRRLRGMSSFTIDELSAISLHFGVPASELLKPPYELASA